MAKKSKNLLLDDPTRTLTLRNRAVSETNRRYGEVKALITESVVENKVFVENAQALKPEDFVFLRTPQKLERFDAWLVQVWREIILAGEATGAATSINWMIEYFREAYERGVKHTNSRLAQTFGRNQIPIRTDIFAVPFHIEKTSLLFTRDFTQLKGITEATSQQLNYVLGKGLLEGESPRKLAKVLNERIDAIGINRSRLLARTEIINAHNFGKANEGQALSELLGEPVVYQWITAGDIKVRKEHVRRNKKYYTYAEVVKLLGEPNCRCAIVAVPLTSLPEGTEVIGM